MASPAPGPNARRGRDCERGSALLIVLLLAILFETALVAAVWQLQSAAGAARHARERALAYRLAEAGIEHALALSAPGRWLQGDGRLEGGRYSYRVTPGPGRSVSLEATGLTESGRGVTLSLTGRLSDAELRVTTRSMRHFLGSRHP